MLGPILFLIYIIDFPDVVHCSMKLFADDTKKFSTVNTLEQASNFQLDILKAVKWSEDWLLKFYKNKCRHMTLGKSNDFSTYHMGNNQETILSVEEERDLGRTIDNQLKFVKHTQNNIKIANRNLGIIKKNNFRLKIMRFS